MKKMKRVAALLLCLALVLGIVPVPAQAESTEVFLHSSGQFYYAVMDDHTVTITGGAFDSSCPNEDWPITVTIPNEIDGYPVTRIADGAFWSWYALDTIYLPDTLEEIGNDAFKACENLRVVEMPHVLSIGDYAFRGCLSLEAIVLPSSVERLGKFVYWECDGIREISIGEVTGRQPDHLLDWDYASVFYEMGSPEIVKIGNVVREFDIGYVFRDQLRELWVAKSVSLVDAHGMGIRSDTVVYGYTGSTAERYAEKEECTFVPLDSDGTAEEPLSMELVDVTPSRGGSYGRVEDLKLTFNMTPARNVYGGSIYIKNYDTDKTVLELDWERINQIALYDGNSVRLPDVLDDLGQGEYYVLIDKGLFEAERVTDDGILYGFPGITQKEYWTFSVQGNPILELKGETFKYYSCVTKETESYFFDYTDEWFFRDNTDYNHDLARMSIRMAMAAARTGTTSIEYLFDKLNLSYTQDSIHYPTPTKNTIGYAIGSRTVVDDNGEKINLVAVAVRGGGYKDEWANNFIIGSGTEHEGFSDAADMVVSGIRSYVSMMPDKRNVRIWITGFSRAAAVSNLAAHELNRLAAEDALAWLSEDSVYAYCFECPRGVRIDDPEYGRFDDSIFNIVNPVDPIPLVAPSRWDFAWYGTTYFLPSREYSYQTFMDRFEQMQNAYENILLRTDTNKTVEDLTETMPGQQGFLRDLVDALADFMGSQSNYVRKYQNSVSEAMVTIQGSDDELGPVLKAIIDVLPGFSSQYPDLAVTLLNNLGNIGRAHYPELCLAWMDETVEEDLTDEALLRYIKINCPVNVFVYDSQGDFVASIVDDEPNSSSRVEAYVDVNGQKIITLPLDGEFLVEMGAYGDGTVSCQIEEYDIATGKTTRLVNYYDVPIQKGDDLDVTVGRGDSDKADYTFTDADGETVAPDADVTGNQIRQYTLTVNADGNGTVTGGGVFLEGESAMVTAQPDEGETFLGWYAGERKVSSEREYRFRVEADLELVGRFSETSGTTEPDVPKPVVNPFTDVKEKDYFYQPVLWAVENGITSGVSATRFAPSNPCTRGQVVTFLWRAAGQPEPSSTKNPFRDVKSSAFYYKAVLWAVEQGITTGISATSFGPDSPCTRGQVVTFLHRAAGEPEPSSARNPFRDVKSSAFYYQAVLWAVEQGITTGVSAASFGPGQTCTRGQVVTFLYRAR